ncbi:hypothetical protein PF005_g16635, partial [Phytophthora fragariae]
MNELHWTQDELATAVRSLDRVTTALQNSEAELDRERSTSGGSAPLAPTSSAPVPAASGSASTSVTRLSEELRQARRDLASLRASRDVSTNRVVQLEGDNRQLREEISQLNQGDIRALEAQLSDVQNAYARLRRVNDDLRGPRGRIYGLVAGGRMDPPSSCCRGCDSFQFCCRDFRSFHFCCRGFCSFRSAAGVAAPLSSASTTPTRKRARDRSASPTLGSPPLKRAGSVSYQLPPSRSRSPSPALSLSSDEEIDQGPGGPGRAIHQEVIEIQDDGAESESDHAGTGNDQVPPVGGQTGSGTSPGSGGSPEYGPPQGGNAEEEEEEENESDPEALAALARSRSEARRRQSVSPAIQGTVASSYDPTPPIFFGRIESLPFQHSWPRIHTSICSCESPATSLPGRIPTRVAPRSTWFAPGRSFGATSVSDRHFHPRIQRSSCPHSSRDRPVARESAESVADHGLDLVFAISRSGHTFR